MRVAILPNLSTLRGPTELESLFYHELLGSLRDFAASNEHDSTEMRGAKLMAQRFKKDSERYAYVPGKGSVALAVVDGPIK